MKFKNNKELISFIFMNIFGAPFTMIAGAIFFGWWGFLVCLILFFVCFGLTRYFGGHKAKLGFNPSFGWAGKAYHIKKIQ